MQRSMQRAMQNKVLRYMTSTSRYTYTSVAEQYSRLNLLNLDLYILEISKFMFRNSKTSLPSAFDEYFRPIGHEYDTRIRTYESLTTPRPRIEFGKQSIKYTGVKIWNSLPSTVQDASSYERFSTLVKAHILENQRV